ncbi:hypothetical protein PILCRDRAFT_61 [Piloderma croceum F 1598]|uniref:Uncharacterized protein n=1 Tax=Piloderma croceum (strain F 1598) TaxID=765440 RepID=A0A0C3GMY8_PILCF|nr:hypothetical protein PILCRDRAFT_61 [Piloderma croceum F 1598]
MNTFESYLLLPSTLDSADDADDSQFLFQHPQTPLPTEPTYTDLTPSHLESVLPTVLSGTPTDLINPMSMFYASEGIAKVWDNFLQTNAQGRNSSFHAKDYYVVRAVSPYFMLHPTKLSAWFITWSGTAGKDNPSGMSRLIIGTPLHLEDITICTHTCALEFHVYHCVLGLPFLRQGSLLLYACSFVSRSPNDTQVLYSVLIRSLDLSVGYCLRGSSLLGGYTFYYTNPHVFTCETIPHAEDPVSTIVAILDYHTTKAGRYLTIQLNTFNQEMVLGYPNLAKPPRHI